MKSSKKLKIFLFISVLSFNYSFIESANAFDNPIKSLFNNSIFPIKKNYRLKLLKEAKISETTKDSKKTFDLYERINNLYPNSPDVLQAYSAFCEKNKFYIKAIKLNQELYKLQKQEKYQLKIAKLYSLQGDITKSIEVYHSILANNPNDVDVVRNLISYYYYSGKYSSASQMCDKYSLLGSDSQYKLICGKSYFYSKSPQKAKKVIQSYVLQNGSDYNSLKLLLDISTAANDYNKAAQTLEKMISYKPNDFELKTKLAGIYLKTGEPGRAANVYKKVLSTNPDNPRILTSLMDCYLAAKDFDNAEAIMQKLIRIYPNSYKLKKNLSNAYLAQQKYSKANKIMKTMAHSNRNQELLNNLAFTYEKMADYSKAAETKERILQEHPNNLELKKEIAFLYQKSQNEEKAEQLFDEILQSRPNDKQILEIKANLNMNNGNFKEAVICFKKLSNLEPKNSKFKLKLADSYMALSDHSNAIPVFSSLAGMYPLNASYKVKLGEAYMASNNNEEASKVLEKALKLDNKNLKILNYLVDTNASLKNYSKASTYLFKVITLFKGSPEDLTKLKVKLSGLYMGAQDFYSAETVLTDLCYSNPNNKSIMLMLSDTYLAQKKFKEAEITLEKVVKLSPEDIDSTLKLAKTYNYLEKYSDAKIILENTIFCNQETAVLLLNKDILAQNNTPLVNKTDNMQQNNTPNAQIPVKNTTLDENNSKLRGLVEKYPYINDVLNALVDSYLGEGNYDAAINTVDKLLVFKPDDQDLLMKKGNIYLIAGKFDKSAEIFKVLVAKYPDNLTYAEYLANSYLALENFKGAIELLKPIVTSNNKNEKLVIKYAEALNAYGEFNEAKKFLLGASITYPDNLKIKELIGDSYIYTENFQAALNYYNLVYEKKKNSDITYKLAEANRFNKHLDKAEKLYASLKDSPKYREKAAVGIGYIRIEQHKILAGRDIFEKVYKANPNSFDAKLGLASSYIYTEDFLKGLSILDTLPEYDSRVKYEKAVAYEKMGMPNKAVFCLKAEKSQRAQKLLKTLATELAVDFKPKSSFLVQEGNPDQSLTCNTFGLSLSKNIGHNMSLKAATMFDDYFARSHSMSDLSMTYLVGLKGRPFKKFSFDSDIGVKTFSGNGGMLVSRILTNYYFNDSFKINAGFTRDNVKDSFLSAVGIRPDAGPYAGALVGQVVDNKFLTGYNWKLPASFFNYGNYNFGIRNGANVSSNLYQEAILGVGKILFSRPKGSLVDLVMPEISSYYTGYQNNQYGFNGASLNSYVIGQEYSNGSNPALGGYFSPKYMLANKVALHLRGSLDKINTGYYLYGYVGEQNIASQSMNMIWGTRVSLILNEKGKFGLGLNYMVEDYQEAIRQDYFMNIIMRL